MTYGRKNIATLIMKNSTLIIGMAKDVVLAWFLPAVT